MLTFNETHTFTRPITATYIDINGDEQTAAINEPRFEFEDGQSLGLKFGAQDTATCPLTESWYRASRGTYIARAQAPNDIVIARAGVTELLGVTTLKTYVIRWQNGENLLAPEIELFPNADTLMGPAYFQSHLYRPVFINDQTIDDMLFFNNLINGDWT